MTAETPLLTIAEAARYLGISIRTLRTPKYQARIRAVPVTDRRVGYRKTTLDKYIDEREQGGK